MLLRFVSTLRGFPEMALQLFLSSGIHLKAEAGNVLKFWFCLQFVLIIILCGFNCRIQLKILWH